MLVYTNLQLSHLFFFSFTQDILLPCSSAISSSRRRPTSFISTMCSQDSQLLTSILVRWVWEERAALPRACCGLGGPVVGKRHFYFTSLSLSRPTGMQFFHSLLCVLIQFLILRLMGRTITAVFTTFFFQMVKLSFLLHRFVERSPLFSFALPSSNCGWKSGDRSKPAGRISLNNPNNDFFQTYLMAGYYFTATEHYDIKWTMPHCVLTLKLIGEWHLPPISCILQAVPQGREDCLFSPTSPSQGFR